MVPFLSALLMAAVPAPAGAATAGRPALLKPVVEAAARCSAEPRLVIAVTQFTPPRGGHATLAVSLRTADGRTRALGHVGIFPERPFSVALKDAQRFGFAVPRAALGQRPTVVVEMGGEGNGARALIGEARISPGPRSGC